MKQACPLCGARAQSNVCTNSLCQGFGKSAIARSTTTPRSNPFEAQFESNSSKVIHNTIVRPTEPFDSPQGTTIPRHIAGVLDNVLAWFFSIVCAKVAPDAVPGVQLAVAVLAFLGYFFVFEAIFCTTPAKFMNGLVVRNFSGGRCTIRQTLVRTLFRLIEVNPALLGALPAAACILWSRNKQRLGDRVAGTVVVLR